MKTLLELKCPSCGAQLDYETGMEYIFCKYCGTKILINDENTYTYKTVDYAEIEKAKNESKRISIQEDIIKREYEKEEKETKRYNKNSLIFAGMLAVFVIATIISLSNNSDSPAGVIMMLVAMYFVIFLVSRGENHKEKEKLRYKNRMKTQGINIIELNHECFDYENKDFNHVKTTYEALGFRNIRCVPMRDLNFFSGFLSGRVESVTINGKSLSDELYQEEDMVVIKYHSR